MTSHITVLGDVGCAQLRHRKISTISLLQCTKEFTLTDMIKVQNTAHIPPFHCEYEQDCVHGTEYDYLAKFLSLPLFQSSLCGKRN